MSNGSISLFDGRLARCAPAMGRLALGCIFGLGLAGCSDTSSEGQAAASATVTPAPTSSAVFDVSLEETPCDIVPKELVAKTFNLPVEQIVVAGAGSSTCAYEWEGDGKMLEVSLGVDVFDTAEAAADRFRSTTRGISAKQVSDAMKSMADTANEADGSSAATQGAVDQLSSMLGGGGLYFEDVAGLADAARFGTRFATLYVLQGNLQFHLNAYHGGNVALSDSGKSIMAAIKDWQEETLPARKQQSIELAKEIVAAL